MFLKIPAYSHSILVLEFCSNALILFLIASSKENVSIPSSKIINGIPVYPFPFHISDHALFYLKTASMPEM